MPDWYLLIVAARYLGVEPWKLAEMPVPWVQWALTSKAAETEAHNNPGPKMIRPGDPGWEGSSGSFVGG